MMLCTGGLHDQCLESEAASQGQPLPTASYATISMIVHYTSQRPIKSSSVKFEAGVSQASVIVMSQRRRVPMQRRLAKQVPALLCIVAPQSISVYYVCTNGALLPCSTHMLCAVICCLLGMLQLNVQQAHVSFRRCNHLPTIPVRM